MCPSLEKLTLAVCGVKHASISPVQQRIEMPCVTDLNLDFVFCHAAPLKMFFAAVHFPQVTTVELRITSPEEEDGMACTMRIIFSAVLPNSEEFPKLTDMILHILARRLHKRERWQCCARQKFPFLSQRCRILETWSSRHVGSDINLIPVGIALPNIRTLALRDCRRIQTCWLALFLKHIKVQGDLDSLRGVCRR